MAIVIVNGKSRYEVEVDEYDSVFHVMVEAQNRFWGPESSIDAVSVNGDKIETLDEETLAGIPGADAEIEVTLVTKEQRGMDVTLGEAKDYLKKLESGLMELSSAIRVENSADAYQSLSDGMNGLSTILDLFNALRDGEGIPEDLKRDYQEFITELNEKVHELTDAQESQDPTLIADILEYEFVEAVRDLLGFLERFAAYTIS